MFVNQKSYFVGINITAAYLTEQLEEQQLLPANYYVQLCKNLETLNSQIELLERADVYCGALVTIKHITYPLAHEYTEQVQKLQLNDVFVLLVSK